MPLVNVVHGDRIPTSAFNVRMPVWRPSLWLLIPWWTSRLLLRTTVVTIRFWWATLPAIVAAYLWLAFGWPVLTIAAVLVTGGLVGWHYGDRPSFARWLGRPYAARWRGWWIYRRRWMPVTAASGLAVAFGGDRYTPRILRVRTTVVGDEVTVRMLPGQTPADWQKIAPALAHTFLARDGKAWLGDRPDRVVLAFRHVDPLTGIVAPMPVPLVPDMRRLPVARREDGSIYRLNLSTHLLVAGASDAGKGSVLWSIVNALAGGVAAGTVRIVGMDPKGGMELAPGERMFWRFCYGRPEEMADTLDELVAIMRTRADRLRGVTRLHRATVDDPTYVIVIDELGSLTSYGVDRKTKERIRDALGLLLSQGRACGVHVVGALQDPRKEVLSFRDLFPVRIALRLVESSHVDMVLNDGAYERGAHCDAIPDTTAGVGYVLDRQPHPVAVRFSFHTDGDLADLCARYGRMRLVHDSGAEDVA
jgi:DNA segregation ATPase FtsK/SpoIIIE, S-DNA-T family